MAKAIIEIEGELWTQCPICGRWYLLAETDLPATPCPDCDPR